MSARAAQAVYTALASTRVCALLRPGKLLESARMLRLSSLVAVAMLTACNAPAPQTGGVPDIYQRSRHEVTLPPQAAAACIARNTKALGYFADLSPLYGTQVMAVTAKTLPAGGVDIAAIQLLPEGAGSRAQVTATTETLREQPDVIRSLLAGC